MSKRNIVKEMLPLTVASYLNDLSLTMRIHKIGFRYQQDPLNVNSVVHCL